MPESTAKEYLEKARVAIEQNRSLLAKCNAEKRAWTAEEEATATQWREEARRYREMAKAEVENDKAEQEERGEAQPVGTAIKPPVPNEELSERMSPERAEQHEQLMKLRKFEGVDYERDYRKYLRASGVSETILQTRAMQADLDAVGGYWLAPITMVNQFLKNVDDLVQIRGLATKFQVPNSLSLGVPTLRDDADDFEFTSELATGSDQDDITTGKRELKPYAMAKRIKLSEKLIRAAVMDVAKFVLARLAYKAAGTEEKAFMTGSGSNEPLGLFVNSVHGISSARDFSTGNTTTAPKFAGLKTAKWKLKPQYRVNAKWLFHSDVLLKLDTEVDNDGQFIWQPSVVVNQPDLVLGKPVIESLFAPSTLTAGQYVGMLGDFQYYWIADALNLAIKVLDQLYAEQNKIGYLLRAEVDGQPVLEEAFSRVTLAAS